MMSDYSDINEIRKVSKEEIDEMVFKIDRIQNEHKEPVQQERGVIPPKYKRKFKN